MKEEIQSPSEINTKFKNDKDKLIEHCLLHNQFYKINDKNLCEYRKCEELSANICTDPILKNRCSVFLSNNKPKCTTHNQFIKNEWIRLITYILILIIFIIIFLFIRYINRRNINKIFNK